jgi:methyl-accepting chemotaxis protein
LALLQAECQISDGDLFVCRNKEPRYNKSMGLLSDFSDFMNEARSLGDEVRGTIQDTADTIIQNKEEVVQTVSDTKTELSDTISEIKETTNKSTSINSNE